jgi:hypothetical protein
MSAVLRRSPRIAAKATKTNTNLNLEIINKLNELENKRIIHDIVEHLFLVSNVFEFMCDERFKEVYIKNNKFRKNLLIKIQENNDNLSWLRVPYYIAIRYYEVSTKLMNYIESIEKAQ